MSTGNDPLKDSCEYALDLTKQFLTLSSAGIAFVVGLVFADQPGKLPAWAVGWGLAFFGLSIVCGWLCCMRMTGKVNKLRSYDVFEPFAQCVSALQILLFCAAVLVLFFQTLHAARHPGKSPPAAAAAKP